MDTQTTLAPHQPTSDHTAGEHAPLICTIGDLILDVLVLPNAPVVPDGDRPATIMLAGGGQAANVAAWARFLGARSRLICARGTDEASEIAVARLQHHGVEIRGPVIEGHGGVVVSTREPDGARTMASDRGVAALLNPSALDPAWVRSAEVLHVSGYCLLREPIAQAALAAARAARRVTLDLASAPDVARYGAQRFTALVEELNPAVIFATEAERAAVPDLNAASWVIKRGARGALFPEGHLDSIATEVTDTTGAGDALAAGYLLGGPSLAMIAAARCVATIGAMPPSAPATRTVGAMPPPTGAT
ncbi:MAG: carbohydrate kinase family protein [Solirubrobacteraceae bacterium]